MCGARKFAAKYITRDDIAALTPEASRISGIPMVSEIDRRAADDILSDMEREEVEQVLTSR